MGLIHKSSIESWNRAVSYDCIQDCIKPILTSKGQVDDVDYQSLETYLNDLEKTFSDFFNSITEINKTFIQLINNWVFNGESILTGTERFAKDYHTRVIEKFKGLKLENFNWNWKVLCVIAEDPHEMLIGDATLGVFDIRPELFITKQGKVTRESDSNYTKFQENEVNNTYLITGVEIYEELLEVLGDIFTP